MSWIKNNKNSALILGGALITSVGLVGWSYSLGSQTEEALENYSNLKAKVEASDRLKTTPRPDAVSKYEQSISEYQQGLAELKERLQKFGGAELESVDPQVFQERLKDANAQLRELAKEKGVQIPDNFYLGFEPYQSKLPSTSAASELAYCLKGQNWLLSRLFSSGAVRIVSINRSELAVEKASDAGSAAASVPKKAASESELINVQRMPVELVFQGTRSSWSTFLNLLLEANAEYFYTIRGIRVINEKQTGPKADEFKFEEAAPANTDSFSEFTFPTNDESKEVETSKDKPAPSSSNESNQKELPPIPSEPKGKELVREVLGGEKIYVALHLELVRFLPTPNTTNSASIK